MAKPISETPVLKGKDAKAFLDRTNEKNIQKVSSEERARIQQNYEKLKSITKFSV
jgi:hypothetical protein